MTDQTLTIEDNPIRTHWVKIGKIARLMGAQVDYNPKTGCAQIYFPGRGIAIQITCRREMGNTTTHVGITNAGLVNRPELLLLETYEAADFPNPTFRFPL